MSDWRPRITDRLRRRALLACLLGWMLAPSFATPEPGMPPPIDLGAPDGVPPWLDEVRAQREAWEARREAARERHEQRRRLANPRGAAQQDAWEEDLRRRRAERREHIEQERERFHGSWPSQMWPLIQDDPSDTDEHTETTPTHPSAFTPPGWNNLWYFRGY